MTTIENKNTKYIDYLAEDKPIPGQLWMCISFLSPEGIKNCSIRGLKVRGIYGTRQEADTRAAELHTIDPDFHVFVGEMGKWLAWDPDPNSVEDQIYKEKELNELMKGYKENIERSKNMQEQRKTDMKKQAAIEEKQKIAQNQSQGGNKTRERLQKKIEAKKQQNKVDSIAKRKLDMETELTEDEIKINGLENEVKNNEQIIADEKEKLDETQKEINEKSQSLDSIETKLAKIQELYSKIHKK